VRRGRNHRGPALEAGGFDHLRGRWERWRGWEWEWCRGWEWWLGMGMMAGVVGVIGVVMVVVTVTQVAVATVLATVSYKDERDTVLNECIDSVCGCLSRRPALCSR